MMTICSPPPSRAVWRNSAEQAFESHNQAFLLSLNLPIRCFFRHKAESSFKLSACIKCRMSTSPPFNRSFRSYQLRLTRQQIRPKGHHRACLEGVVKIPRLDLGLSLLSWILRYASKDGRRSIRSLDSPSSSPNQQLIQIPHPSTTVSTSSTPQHYNSLIGSNRLPTHQTFIIMGLENDFKEIEGAATGQGGNDGDNNANNANGSNDKTEDTMVDSGKRIPHSSC
jgi:hypothetical protein